MILRAIICEDLVAICEAPFMARASRQALARGSGTRRALRGSKSRETREQATGRRAWGPSTSSTSS